VATMKELESQRIPFEIRDLSAGDFLWVARYNDQELVLPYIIERKRSDDFAKSIKDNRYKEQKV
jgi:crossover junction endonuclease MUS81